MNAYDVKRMAVHLESVGFEEVEDYASADIIIFNTCYIRGKAADKVWSELGRIYDEFGHSRIIALVGCMAKAEGAKIFKRAPYVGIVLSSRQYHKLPELLRRAQAGESRLIDTELEGLKKFDSLPALKSASSAEFIQVQEGCDQYCTYCCVPYTRGREVSRPPADVLQEARGLAQGGATEICLVGQNVNAYAGEGGLSGLIHEIAKLPQVEKIRYTTAYPSRYSDELIALHASEPKLAKLLYLPAQSGSDKILKNMNRKYTRDSYLALVDKIRAVNPELKISSDFIVGFPGETDDDFEQTLSLIQMVGFVNSYSFKFSPRPGTPAATMEGQIPEKIKTARIRELQKLLKNHLPL